MWCCRCRERNRSSEFGTVNFTPGSPASGSDLDVWQQLENQRSKNEALEQKIAARDERITKLEEKMECVFLNGRRFFNAIMEADTHSTAGSGAQAEDTGSDHDLNILRTNYTQLMDTLSISIERVVAFLFQSGIVTQTMKEAILAETRNRYIRASSVLDTIISHGSRSEAFEALYQATLESELWMAADILHADQAPHTPTARTQQGQGPVGGGSPNEYVQSPDITNQALRQQIETINALKSCHDIAEKTAFRVKLMLDKGSELRPSAMIRLNVCREVQVDSDYFHRDTAMYTVPVDGIYLFNVTVSQNGIGELVVGMGLDSSRTYNAVATFIKPDWENVDRDIRSGGTIMRLTQGQPVGVYVLRSHGKAQVEWCRFSGCLLACSTSDVASTSPEAIALTDTQ